MTAEAIRVRTGHINFKTGRKFLRNDLARVVEELAMIGASVGVSPLREVTFTWDGIAGAPSNSAGPSVTPWRTPKPGDRPSLKIRVAGLASSNPHPHTAEQIAHRGRSSVRAIKVANTRALVDAPSESLFWKAVRHFSDSKPRDPPFSARDLRRVFFNRLNVLSRDPSFSDRSLEAAEQFASQLANATEDVSEGQWFSRSWEKEEIQALLAELNAKQGSAATGPDGPQVSYQLVAEIPWEVLQRLYNACLLHRDVPDQWLSSILVGVLKKRKDYRLPESYRAIGLESCLLKGLTWLMDRRIRRWAEEYKVLPWCQNGFRPGLRTNNNSFTLLAAIHTAKALGRPLVVVLVDLMNAFPSVNQDILWRKLWNLGIRGPIFDTVRAIYRNMDYVVRLRDELSEPLSSNVGILAGDPGSPFFWILYALDCTCHVSCRRCSLHVPLDTRYPKSPRPVGTVVR